DGGIVGWPLGTTVPTVVVGGPILVLLAIGVVVLLVVAHQVVEGEAVVAGDKIDAGVGFASVALVQIAGATQARGKLRQRVAIPLPETPHRIAVCAVPLAPEHREVPHL